MSQRPPDDRQPAPDDEWEPRFPHEVVLDRLSSTRRTRFTLYTVALFVVVAVAFAIPFVPQSLFDGSASSASRVTIRIAPERRVFDAVLQVVVLSPVLALVSGVVAGFWLRGSSLSRGVVGGAAAVAGLLVLLALLFAVGLIAGVGPAPSTDGVSLGGAHPLGCSSGWASPGSARRRSPPGSSVRSRNRGHRRRVNL